MALCFKIETGMHAGIAQGMAITNSSVAAPPCQQAQLPPFLCPNSQVCGNQATYEKWCSMLINVCMLREPFCAGWREAAQAPHRDIT